MMIFAIIAFIVIGLVIWSAISLSVTSGNEKVQPTGAGGAPAPGFPSPTDVWNSITLPAGVGGAYSAASSTLGSASLAASSASAAAGSASAAASSAWNSTASIQAAATAGGNPPPGAAGAPAPPAPPGGIFSFIPGWNQPTGSNVNTSVTVVPGAPNITEGQAYMCSSQPGAIYRGFNNTIRVYPSPTVAASWDTRWGSPITIDCSKVERGPQMEMNPDPKMIEGHSYTCAEGGVYRAMNGMLRWYPNPPIAASWDPAWASPVKIDCSGVKKGDPMQMAPSPALPGAESSAPAPVVPAPVKPDTSATESRMKAVVDDLNQQHASGYWRTNSGNVKINEAEYAQLSSNLAAAGVSWIKPKYDPGSPSNALM